MLPFAVRVLLLLIRWLLKSRRESADQIGKLRS